MTSVWRETVGNERAISQSALIGDEKVDVLIIGGGMAGILTAHALKEAGVSCAIVEAKKIGDGVTKNTTAKITAQHGLIYADLQQRFGSEKARLYYEANAQAVKKFRELSKKYPCDLEEKTAYVYSTNDREKLEREAKAYEELQIPGLMANHSPLPFETTGAIGMKKQAQFHPLKLLNMLGKELTIYENTFIKKIQENVAFTDTGSIQAEHIILATHFPFINIPGLYFLKLYQHRSYVLALKQASLLDGMYIDEKEGGFSFRTYKDLLLVGGGGHKTGKQGGCWEELRSFTRQAYVSSEECYHWATQDCMTLDGVPYIGRHRSQTSNLYVATGFNKWGMTGSMVASRLLCDLITEGKSDLESLYSPKRSIFTKQLIKNVGGAAKGLFSIGPKRCSHMGCKLHWNKEEQSWDCSCHGSRYDNKGNVIDNPAKKGAKL